jgi:hypothetical protein
MLLLWTTGCYGLAPGVSEAASIERAATAANDVGATLLKADSAAQTHEVTYRAVVVPAGGAHWFAWQQDSGELQVVENSRAQLPPGVKIERIEGMTPQPDGSYILIFTPKGGVARNVNILFADEGGGRRYLQFHTSDTSPRVVAPEELE